jgi:hypothetical protein
MWAFHSKVQLAKTSVDGSNTIDSPLTRRHLGLIAKYATRRGSLIELLSVSTSISAAHLNMASQVR